MYRHITLIQLVERADERPLAIFSDRYHAQIISLLENLLQSMYRNQPGINNTLKILHQTLNQADASALEYFNDTYQTSIEELCRTLESYIGYRSLNQTNADLTTHAVSSEANTDHVADTSPSGTNTGSVADTTPSGTNIGSVADAATSETNAGPVADAVTSETNAGSVAPAATSETNTGPVANTAPSETNSGSATNLDDELALQTDEERPNFPPQATPPSPPPHKPARPTYHLPQLYNAKIDQPYNFTLPADLPITDIHFDPPCGLVWDAANHRIHGTPTTSGDINVRVELRDEMPGLITLHINPDPQRLWQNKPSDPQGRFAKDDSAHDMLTTPQGRLLAARVRGRSHAHVGSYCDDDYRVAYHEKSGVHLLVVSDGAGSAQYARYGSQLAVEAVKNTIYAWLNDAQKPHSKLAHTTAEKRGDISRELIAQAVYAAHVAHINESKAHGIDLKSLSCTLLIGLAVPLDNGHWYSAAYQIGDGAVALWLPESGTLHLLGEADSGAYSGETQFLTRAQIEAADIQKRIRERETATMPVMLLMTDGVSDPKFETDAGLKNPALWQALWQELKTPLAEAAPDTALLDWLDFWSRGNHDDRTIALLIPADKESA